MLIFPNASRKARHLALSDLLVAAQQRDTGKNSDIGSLRDQIVLARTPANPLSPPDVFAATIATIQSNAYVRRVSWVFDCVVLLLAAAVVGKLREVSRIDLVLGAIAFTAAYCLAALAIVSRWLIWLPGCLPLGAVWLLVLLSVLIRHRSRARRDVIAMPPPAP
jgi:TRAP-type mannitol/chloroaromatic compound transport system permease small subunit